MNELTNRIYKLKIWTDCRGQDLVEYALATGMVAVSAIGAMPLLTSAISSVFNKVGSTIIANVH